MEHSTLANDKASIQSRYAKILNLNLLAKQVVSLRQMHQERVMLRDLFSQRPDLPLAQCSGQKALASLQQQLEKLKNVEQWVAVNKLLEAPNGINQAIRNHEQACETDPYHDAVMTVMPLKLVQLRLCLYSNKPLPGDLASLDAQIDEQFTLLAQQQKEWVANANNLRNDLARWKADPRSAPRLPLYETIKAVLQEIHLVKVSLRKDHAFALMHQEYRYIAEFIEREHQQIQGIEETQSSDF